MQQEEILNYILAGSIIVLTAMLAILLFYLISIARNIRWFVKGAKEKVEKVADGIDFIKDKIEHGASQLGFIARAIERLISSFISVGLPKKRKK